MKKIFFILFAFVSFVSFGQNSTISTQITNGVKNVPPSPSKLGATFDMLNIANATVTASGTNTYTASVTGMTTYAQINEINVIFTNANTSTATLNINSLGAIAITKNGTTALVAGDIPAGSAQKLIYDGTEFQIKVSSSGGTSTLTSGHIFVGNTSNVATDVALSGDGTMSSAGALSVTKLLGNVIPANTSGSLTNNGSGTLSWVPASGSGTVTSVAATGGSTGLSFTGSPITTSGTLILGGTLGVANGGTGTASPGIVAGPNVTVTGTWPNQTVASSGGGSGITTLTGDVTATGSGSVAATVKGANGVLYSGLTTGLLKNTTSTGVPSIATGADYVKPTTTLGTIYSATTFASLAGFTNNGCTVSASSGALNFSSGPGNFTQTLDLDIPSNLEHVKIVGVFTATTVNSSSYGFGIGKHSTNTYLAASIFSQLDAHTGGGGLIKAYDGTGANLSVGTGVPSLSSGDQIEVTMEVDETLYTFSARNLTNPGTTAVTQVLYTENITTAPNTGKYCISSIGGAFTLNSLIVTSNDIVGADLLNVADSKGYGYGSTGLNRKGYVTLLRANFASVVNNAGSGDRIAEVASRTAQIISLAPKRLLMAIGSNDFRSGRTSTQVNTDYDAVITTLAAGLPNTEIWHLLPFSEASGNNQSTLVTHLLATYPTRCIRTDLSFSTAATDCLAPDFIHPNDLGNRKIYSTILSGLPLATNPNRFTNFVSPLVSNDVLVSDINGRPQRSAPTTAGTALGWNGTSFAWSSFLTDPTTTDGDFIQRVGGVLTRLPSSSNSAYVLTSNGPGVAASWQAPVAVINPLTFDGASLGGGTTKTRFGVYADNGNYSQNYNWTTGAIDDATKYTSNIIQQITTTGASMSLGLSTAINTTPTYSFRFDNNGNFTSTSATHTSLSGTGTRMVTTDASGNLGSAAIPGGLTAGTNGSDANYTAVANTYVHLPISTLTANRNFVIPTATNGNTLIIKNNEIAFSWLLTGPSVYYGDDSTILTQFIANTTYELMVIDGHWTIKN